MIHFLRWMVADRLIYLAIMAAPVDPARVDLILTLSPWFDRQRIEP